MNKLTKFIILVTIGIVFLQLKISFMYEDKAKQIGRFDEQEQELSIKTLEYQEKIAVYRSNFFMINNFLKGYSSKPSKIIYLKPYASDDIMTQK